jgi:hypothetical protein
MIRYILAALALLAAPAVAEQYRIVGGQPAPTIAVVEGDTLVSAKPLVEKIAVDGTLTRRFPVWIDRAKPAPANGFQITAEGLRLVGFEPGNGYVYAVVGAPAKATPTMRFGVNISGCEFSNNTALCPTTADIDTYIAKGFTLIRLPVKDVHLRGDNLSKIAALVAYAQTKGVQVILDRHDYTRHSAADAWSFWRSVLPSFSPDTLIELANEPVHGYPAGSNPWLVSAQDTKDTVTLFRANGVTNPILYGSPGYSSTYRFTKPGGSRAAPVGMGDAIDNVGGIIDPLNKTYFSGHKYFDKGGSGTSSTCTDTGDAGIATWAAGMRKRGIKGYLTEFAWGRHNGITASCRAVGDAVMAAIKANSDVILGTTAWGGGRAWGESYTFKIEPAKGTFKTAPLSIYVERLTGR